MPKTETEVLERIMNITKSYQHVLDCGPATVQVNAPRALMQVEACALLSALYWILGKQRPKFKCDDEKKLDR